MSVEQTEFKALDDKFEYPPSNEHYVPQIARTTKNIEAPNTDLALALLTSPQLSPTCLKSLELYFILLVPFMVSFSYGLDGSVMGGVYGMIQYHQYFHISSVDAAGGVGTVTALITGLHTIGSIVGVAIAGPMSDRFGRRGGMFAGSVLIVIGAFVCMLAQNTQYLFGGRFILGCGTIIAATAAPIYVVEMSPPQWRGRLAGLYNMFYMFGSIVCAMIAYGTSGLNSSMSWRALLGVQIAPAGILVLLVFLLPESPRWLVSVGRKEEARRILARYHGNDDEHAPLVRLEWKELEEGVKLNGPDKRWWDYSGVFGTRTAQNRSTLAILMGFLGQRTGIAIVSFFSILIGNLGVTIQQATFIGFGSLFVTMVGGLIGTSIADKVRRRTLWVWGMASIAGVTAILTACLSKWGVKGADLQGSTVTIAFIMLLGFVSSVVYTPIQVLYPVECLDYNARAKGMAMSYLAQIAGSLVDTYASPVAIKALHWKYFAIITVFMVNNTFVVWFMAVETKGRTLEEMDEIFEGSSQRDCVKRSLSKRNIKIQENRSFIILNLEPVTATAV